jgi:ATP-dependent Zn protease
MRRKCLFLFTLGMVVGVSARPASEHVAAKVMDPMEKLDLKVQQRVAIHEAGHAVATGVLNVKRPPTSLHILVEHRRSSGGLGLTMMPGPETIFTSGEIFDLVVELMASMASEAIIMGDVSIGSGNDLAQANNLLVQACGLKGMCGQLIVENGGPDLKKMVSEHLLTAYHRASALIRANTGLVHDLADLAMAQPIVKGERVLNAEQLKAFFASHPVVAVPPESRQIAPIVKE